MLGKGVVVTLTVGVTPMTNRVMKAKMHKMRRQRRAYLKKYAEDFIPVGKSANHEYMKETRSRLRSLANGVPEPTLDGISLARWVNTPDNKVPGGVFAMRIMARQRQSDFNQNIQKFHSITLFDGKEETILLFFSEGNKFFLVRHNKLFHHVSRSIIYPNKERAIQRWREKNVCWVECVIQ